MTSRRGQFIGGLILGAILGVVALIFGLLAMAAALIAVTVIGLLLPRFALLGGSWLGLGGAWLSLIGRASADCARPDMPCGATPPDTTWLLVIALAVALAGCVAGWLSLRTSPST